MGEDFRSQYWTVFLMRATVLWFPPTVEKHALIAVCTLVLICVCVYGFVSLSVYVNPLLHCQSVQGVQVPALCGPGWD